MIGSFSGIVPLMMRSGYCASKSAVRIFYQTLSMELPEIRITQLSLDTFTGSNFRNNSLVKSTGLEVRSNTPTLEEITEVCVGSIDREATEIIHKFTFGA